MFAEYLESRRQDPQGYSRSTLQVIASWLKNFEEYCAGRDPTKLKESDLVAWRQQLVWKGGTRGLYAENTINQAVLVVRAFYRWAQARGHVRTDPAAGLTIRQVPKKKRRPRSATEQRALLSWPNLDTPTGIRNRAVLGILLETGISRPACSRLDLESVQLDIGALFATGRSRGVKALSEGLCCDLERYLKEARPLLVSSQHEKALFLNLKGTRLSRFSVQGLWRKAHLHCGLKL